MLDPSKLYQWFVLDAHTIERNGKAFQILKYQCVTEDVKVSEQYHLPDGKNCEALRLMMQQLGVTNIDVSPNIHFKRGYHFYAKVSPYIESDGTIKYAMQPFSFTSSIKQEVSTKPSIHEVVISVIKQEVAHKAIIDKLANMGPEYVKEYRAIQKQSGGSA
jgi:hypothetical protein